MMNMKEMLGEAGRTMSNLDMLKNKNMRDIKHYELHESSASELWKSYSNGL